MRGLDAIIQEVEAYMNSFRPFNGGMEFKYVHMHNVLENAGLISAGEEFSAIECEKFRLAALFHDVGRFEQQRRYSTFDDAHSSDHSKISCEVALANGWTDDEDVLEAVRLHNKPKIPEGMSPLRRKLVLATKDSDRLDILRGLQSHQESAGKDWRLQSQKVFHVDPYAPPSTEVCQLVLSRKPVDFALLRTVSDCLIMQIGWVLTGFHFATSCRLAVERGHVEWRRKLLKEISDSPLIDRVCDVASLSNFYRGLAGLMAKTVMADGCFQQEEKTMVENIFGACARNGTEYGACMASFDQALAETRGIGYYAALCRERGGEADLAFVMEVLEKLVAADGVVQIQESDTLRHVRQALYCNGADLTCC